MKITVLGSGNGGVAAAVDMALAGHDVSIWDFESFGKNIEGILTRGGIEATGVISGFSELCYAGFDIETALRAADLVLVVGPAYAIKSIAQTAKPHLKHGQHVCVCPSSCGGAIVFKEALGLDLEDPKIIVGETSTLPYATRVVGPGKVEIYHKLRGGLYYAALPSSMAKEAFYQFQTLYPHTEHAKSILMTMMQTGNTIIHPSITLLNAGRIEDTSGNFFFYEDGATPAAGKLMRVLDDEKLAISTKLDCGLIRDTTVKILQGYNTEDSYETGYKTAPGFKGIRAQSTLDTRYMHEDVGYGMVFISALGRQINVPTPVTDAVIAIASVIMERDYKMEEALSPRTLGISSMSVNEMKRIFGQY